jgi:pre-mRNA-processing factor 19
VATFEGHVGNISAISFSENGYYLATAADDASVKLWDLRKLKNFKNIQVTGNFYDHNLLEFKLTLKKWFQLDDGYEVKDLCFDQSGSYLAVAGTDVRVYLCKQWIDLKVFNDHTAMATGVRFGKNASYLASTSMDRTLKLYGL